MYIYLDIRSEFSVSIIATIRTSERDVPPGAASFLSVTPPLHFTCPNPLKPTRSASRRYSTSFNPTYALLLSAGKAQLAVYSPLFCSLQSNPIHLCVLFALYKLSRPHCKHRMLLMMMKTGLVAHCALIMALPATTAARVLSYLSLNR